MKQTEYFFTDLPPVIRYKYGEDNMIKIPSYSHQSIQILAKGKEVEY